MKYRRPARVNGPVWASPSLMMTKDEAQMPLTRNPAPTAARRVAREKREYDRTVEKVVREGISNGRFRNLPPTLLVFGLLGMCNWLYKWYDPRGKLAPDEIAAIFTDLLERGYLSRQGEDKADPLLRTLRRVEERITRLESRLARRPPAEGERRGKGRKAPRA